MNIRTRLTLLFTILVGSILMVFCLAIFYFYDQYREQQFFSYLKDRAQTITHLIEDVEGIEKNIKKIEQSNSAILLGEEVTIYNENDSIIYDSGKEMYPITQEDRRNVRSGKEIRTRLGSREIVLTRHIHSPELKPWVVVAYANDLHGLGKLERLRNILIFGWFVCLFLVGGAGWLFAGDALRPVSDIIGQVNNISAGNLYDRLWVGREKDELTQLSVTFNQMLNRLEKAFIAQKNFVSHASHEFRTPLAVMMGEIEVALMKDRTSEVYKETLNGVLEEVKDLNHLVNGLLELANTEGGTISNTFHKVRIDEVLWQAQSYVTTQNPDCIVKFDYGIIPDDENDLLRWGDETLLRTAFVNLIENGCKYSNNQQVDVSMEVEKELITLHFIDKGNGIPEKDIPFLFDTFFRGVATQDKKGYGIGLALTKRIVTMHGGALEVASIVGKGSDFMIKFPLF